MFLGSLLVSNEFIHLPEFHRFKQRFGLEGLSYHPLVSSRFTAGEWHP